jgi:hypothetical protein
MDMEIYIIEKKDNNWKYINWIFAVWTDQINKMEGKMSSVYFTDNNMIMNFTMTNDTNIDYYFKYGQIHSKIN